MANTKSILNTFTCVRQAREFIKEHKPLIDAIFAHQGKEERLTVRLIGEELMGKEKYHSNGILRDGSEAPWREPQATTLTCQLTQIFRKMCNYGAMTRHEERAKEPIEIEYEGWYYEDKDGNRLPDMVELTDASGRKVEVHAKFLPDARERYGSTTKKIYPKISYYTFN